MALLEVQGTLAKLSGDSSGTYKVLVTVPKNIVSFDKLAKLLEQGVMITGPFEIPDPDSAVNPNQDNLPGTEGEPEETDPVSEFD